MRNTQVYRLHLRSNNRNLAAAVAVKIARDEKTHQKRSKWLQSAINLQPGWTRGALFADWYNEWTILDTQIETDLMAAGLTNQDVWKVSATD